VYGSDTVQIACVIPFCNGASLVFSFVSVFGCWEEPILQRPLVITNCSKLWVALQETKAKHAHHEQICAALSKVSSHLGHVEHQCLFTQRYQNLKSARSSGFIPVRPAWHNATASSHIERRAGPLTLQRLFVQHAYQAVRRTTSAGVTSTTGWTALPTFTSVTNAAPA